MLVGTGKCCPIAPCDIEKAGKKSLTSCPPLIAIRMAAALLPLIVDTALYAAPFWVLFYLRSPACSQNTRPFCFAAPHNIHR